MFTLGVRDLIGCREVSCVKLPANVAFPIDSQLLDRLERSRRALPPNSVKALWRSRAPQSSDAQAVQRPLDLDARPARESGQATIERFPVRVESRLRQLGRIEQLYALSKGGAGTALIA
jgi:hypothetical protein